MSYAMEQGPRTPPITADEFQRLAKVGLLAPNARVELIEGVIVDMAPRVLNVKTEVLHFFRSRTDIGYADETSTRRPGLTPLPAPGLTVDLSGLVSATSE